MEGNETEPRVIHGLHRGPVGFSLRAGGTFLCYDVIEGDNGPYVGYVFDDKGQPVDVMAYVLSGRGQNCGPVFATAGHKALSLRFGRHVALIDLVRRTYQVHRVKRRDVDADILCGAAVSSAYRAGLLPLHRLPELLSAVPSAWFVGAMSYGAFQARLLEVDMRLPNPALSMVEMAVRAGVSFCEQRLR